MSIYMCVYINIYILYISNNYIPGFLPRGSGAGRSRLLRGDPESTRKRHLKSKAPRKRLAKCFYMYVYIYIYILEKGKEREREI